MILALSRFKVANGMEESVAQAFRDRPRLVEGAEGFLSLEVFTDRSDASIFYLSTRWTSEAAFRQWHSSEAHHASHRGIPKGLKLDPAFTQLVVMDCVCQ
jgi:heme-degrading monooxygenase HmoA